jgi:hypothetical protein
MQNFRCFIVNEEQEDSLQPYPCDELIKADFSIYFMQFGLLIVMLSFMVMIRPFTIYIVQRLCCNTTTDEEDISSTVVTENKEIQCDIDMNFQRIIINPDTSLHLTEDAAM